MGQRKLNEYNTEEMKIKFLEEYKKGFSIKNATSIIGVDRSTVYKWRENDLDFNSKLAEIKNNKIYQITEAMFKSAENNPTVLIRLMNSHLFRDTEWKLLNKEDKEEDVSNDTFELEL
jgi:hypothetical protein